MSFINLGRGGHLKSYLGLEMKEGFEYEMDKFYSYVEVPVANPGEVAAGDFTHLVAACRVNPRRNYIAKLTIPDELAAVASVTFKDLVNSGEGEVLACSASFSRDFDTSKLPYLFRIYLLG